MMQKRVDNDIADVTPSLARTMASGTYTVALSCALPCIAVGTSSSAEPNKERASSTPKSLGAAVSPRVLPTDPSAMLFTAIARHVHRCLTTPSAIGSEGADELHSIKKGGANKKYSPPSASDTGCGARPQPTGDSDGDMSAAHLVACTQQVEAHLLRCLLHVELTPGRMPNQPEVIGEALGASSTTTEAGTMEGSQQKRIVPRTVTTASPTTTTEGEQSPPPRHPSVSRVGHNSSLGGNTDAHSRIQSSVPTETAASTSPRSREPSGGIKASELYYTYTNQSIPSSQPRPPSRSPAGVTYTSPMHGPSCSNRATDSTETVKGSPATTKGRQRPSLDSAAAQDSEGALPAYVRGLPVFPCTRGGTVRPLHPTEIHAALRSWPSRITQYVLATTVAEQELQSAAANAGGGTNVDAPAVHVPARSDASASHAHEEGSAFSSASSQAGGDAEGDEDEAGVVIDVLLRRLCDMLQHTRLAADICDAGAGQSPSIDFPSFACFYLADSDPVNAACNSDIDEHTPSQRFGKSGVVQLYLTQLAKVLLSAITSGGTSASGLARQDEADLMGRLPLSGDMVTCIGMLLKSTPLITASRPSSELPVSTPALNIEDVEVRPPLLTARGAVWRALRSLLNFSPLSSHNPTMCTTPFVVGLIRRYTSGGPNSSSGGSGGDGLRIRFLPVADVIGPTGVTTAAAAEPAADNGLRDCQDAAHDPLSVPAFYTAVFLEVTGEDVLHPTANHEDAVTLEEESTSKVQYEADVPKVYRDRHRRRMEVEKHRRGRYSSSATHVGRVLRSGEGNFDGGAGALASAKNCLEGSTVLSSRDRCLSRRACALWEKLLALVHFVHVSGTPAEVETTARYVTLVIRRRRTARQQPQHDPQQASRASVAPVSIAESATLPSVPSFFFTLTKIEALRTAAATAAEARQALFCNGQDDGDDHDSAPFDVEQGVRTKTGSASTDAVAAGRPNFFFRSPGLGLRTLLGWGKGAATSPPDPPASPSSSLQDRSSHSNIRTPPQREGGGPPRRAPPTESPSRAMQDESTEELIMDWMHDVLIPLFFETTVSGSVAPPEGSTAPNKPLEGNERDDSQDNESIAAATAGRRRAPFHLRSKRVLLGRVQAVTPSMVYRSFTTAPSNPPVVAACDMDTTMEAMVHDSMFDAHLLPYLLLNQLFFATDGSSVNATHGIFNSPPPQARSASLSERASEHPHSAAAGQQHSPQAASQSHRLRSMHPLPVSATAAISEHPPNAHDRRVSFLEDVSTSTPLRLDARLPDVGVGARSPLQQPLSTTPSGASPERSSSTAGSPRSILKSGRRYKREKLIRSSAPAVSVVPFRSLFLWRLLAAEVLVSGHRAQGASKQEQQQQQNFGDISAISSTLCTTSEVYLRYMQALAVRVASDVSTAVLLAGLLAEQCACCRQLRGYYDPTHPHGSVAVTEHDHSSTNCDPAGSEKKCNTRASPAEVNAEAARWGALRCDDLLPLANSAALAFAQAALAPILCSDDGTPAYLAGVIKEVKDGVDFSDPGDEDECKCEPRSDPNSDQSNTSATSYVDSHKEQRGVREDGEALEHRHTSAPFVISPLSPCLPADALNRLQTLSVVYLLHIRQEVLENVTRPLDVVIRRLTLALARHRLQVLCRPLDDFVRRSNATGPRCDADGRTQEVHTEQQFWQLVREVLEMYGDCLLLPHLLGDAGALRSATAPATPTEDEAVASNAVVSRPEGNRKAGPCAHEKPSVVLPEEGDVISLLTSCQESPGPLPFAAAGPLTTRVSAGIPKPWLSREQQDQQQQQQPVVRSMRRSRVGFVPLSFGNANFDPIHSSSLLPAQCTVHQALPSRWSVPRTLSVWNPQSHDLDDSYDLHSFAFDRRATRLTSYATQGASRHSSSALNGAIGDFVKAATSALELPQSPSFGSLYTQSTVFGSQARVSLQAGTGTADTAMTSPVLGNCFSRNRTSGNTISMVSSSSRVRHLSWKHGCAGDASHDVDAASRAPLPYAQQRAVGVPAFAASTTAESKRLWLSPPGLFDFVSVTTPHHVVTGTGSAADSCEGSPLCAISSGSDASQLRLQQALISSHGSSFLTLTSAVPLLRRLQTAVSNRSARDGEDDEVSERQIQRSPQLKHQQPQQMSRAGQSPVVGARESAEAPTASTAQAARESPPSVENDDEVAAIVAGTSRERLVVHVCSGVAVESPLLSPFATEAKHMMVKTLLLRWVLPWWAQRTLDMKQGVAAKKWKESNEGHADHTTATDSEVTPNSPAQPLVQRGYSVSPPTTRSTVSTAPASTYKCRDVSYEVAPSVAVSRSTKREQELQRENAELRSRLLRTQRLLVEISQACNGLHMAAQRYKQAVALQEEKRAAAAEPMTTVANSSVSLPGGADPLAPPQQLDLVSLSPPSSTPQVVLRKGGVWVGSPHDNAAPGTMATTDSVVSPLERCSVTLSLADRASLLLLYFAETEASRERVVELCQRIGVLLNGTANVQDSNEHTASLPPSAIAKDSGLPSRFPSSTSAMATSHSFLLHSLSQGMQGSQCISPPEATSVEIAATAVLCNENSARRRHSVVSHGPSQLFSPLEPQSFRRTSTALTLMSLAPAGALAMSSTIAAETPRSTPTPIAVFIVGASNSPSTRSSPVPFSRQSSLQQQQHMPPLPPLFSSPQSSPPSVTSQPVADALFSSADDDVQRVILSLNPAVASAHASSVPLTPEGTPRLTRRAPLRSQATQGTSPQSSTTSIVWSTQVKHEPRKRHSSSVEDVEAYEHTSHQQPQRSAMCVAASGTDLVNSHATQVLTPCRDHHQPPLSRCGENGDGNCDNCHTPPSTVSSPSTHSVHFARRTLSAVESRGSAELSSSVLPPPSPLSSTISSRAFSESPFEVHNRLYGNDSAVTTTPVQGSAIADAATAETTTDAEVTGSNGSAEEPQNKQNDVYGTVAREEKPLAEGEKAASVAAAYTNFTRNYIAAAEDASHSHHEGSLSEQSVVPQARNEMLYVESSYQRPTASLAFPGSREGTPPTSRVTHRECVGTPSSSILPFSSSPSLPTVRRTSSDITMDGKLHLTTSDDAMGKASHNACCLGDDMPVQRVIVNNNEEADDVVRQKSISTNVTVPQMRRPSLPMREDANGSSPASVSSIVKAQACVNVSTAAAMSSSPWRERTPVRNSEAAVTALADLQQRLSGSNSALVELRQQLQQAEQELREKEKAMACITEQFAATEAALYAAQKAASVAEEKARQQQRLFTPSPPPARASVATSTEKLWLAPPALSTMLGGEKAKEVGNRSGTSTSAGATDRTSPLANTAAAMVEPVDGESTANAACVVAVAAGSLLLSAADSSPSSLCAQLLRRVHDLEAELRNANFRMDQWRALLDAERHAHVVQADQLTQRLESEQRRSARASRSRSRSRSLSPLVNGAVPSPCGEYAMKEEARATQLPAPPLSLESIPPPAVEVHPLRLGIGDVELRLASPNEQQRISTLTERLQVVEAHAAEEHTQRVAAENGMRALEGELRVLRVQMEALESQRAIAQAQQRQKDNDADQRDEALRRQVESDKQTLTAMEAAQTASKELQRHLKEELDAERRARSAAVADAEAVHMATQDRLMRSEEVQQQLRRELGRALEREKEALAHAAAEEKAVQSKIAALQQSVESMTDQLRTAEAESREHQHRCNIAETQAAAQESAQKVLTGRVKVLEEELSSIRAAKKQWQKDTEDRERVLRHQYEEAAASAEAAMKAQLRASSDLQQRSEDELRTMQRAQAVKDEAHRTAFEEVTRKLSAAEKAADLALDDLRRERETNERTTAALQECQSEKEELRRRFEDVREKLHLAELDADEQRRQRDRIETAKVELEAACAQQQETAKGSDDRLCREIEAHMRTIATLQEGKSVDDALRCRLEDELQSEQLARAADTAAHKVELASAQSQVSRAEQRAQGSADALRREEQAHARTLAAMQATEEANRQLMHAWAAQEANAQERTRNWLSVREACLLNWMEEKMSLIVSAWSINCAELQRQLHVQRPQQSDMQQQQHAPPLVSPSPTAADSSPVESKRRHKRRSGGVEERYGHLSAPEAVVPMRTPNLEPRTQPEMVVVSVDDPLGLRYELQRKTRHIASLEERVRQLEEAHAVDQQAVWTLQKRVAQKEMRNGNGIAAASHLPPPPPSLPMAASSWSSTSPLRTPSRAWPARHPTLGEDYRTPTAAPQWDPRPRSYGNAASSPGTTERKRLTPNEYRQRYTSL
ncbi:hypothetical protein, conserved [Leishmania tarentolae]|uniref:Uncharacterized protein n=1 Tax=Leishmania tarentolae TaxID=5689 RepID=A0A640KCT4_LEITA|nr:hypothetical protein, conserved [Leishmania tarentolae]